MSVVTANGERWLVAKTGFRTRATKDLPLQIGSFGFRNGAYFCKPAILGGVREFIDDQGEVQTFLFANWIELH
ncbi:MAG TPA: hypothetical protein VGC56_04785 [Allosphingosinicella sp.]|jgi:hypothetical protein